MDFIPLIFLESFLCHLFLSHKCRIKAYCPNHLLTIEIYELEEALQHGLYLLKLKKNFLSVNDIGMGIKANIGKYIRKRSMDLADF